MALDYPVIVDTLVEMIREEVDGAGASGVVVGISGGIDSAVAAALSVKALGRDRVYGLIMPCESSSDDVDHGMLLVEALDIDYKIVDLETTYKALVKEIHPEISRERKPLAYGNIKPRLRMTALYFEGALRNHMVLGTGNKSELVTGYFTKYGDGGVDFEPLGDLLKEDVIALGYHLDLPMILMEKEPMAGLIGCQTDEEEMGITYEDLDQYILTGEGTPEVKAKVEKLYKRSAHKRRMPKIFDLKRNFYLK